MQPTVTFLQCEYTIFMFTGPPGTPIIGSIYRIRWNCPKPPDFPPKIGRFWKVCQIYPRVKVLLGWVPEEGQGDNQQDRDGDTEGQEHIRVFPYLYVATIQPLYVSTITCITTCVCHNYNLCMSRQQPVYVSTTTCVCHNYNLFMSQLQPVYVTTKTCVCHNYNLCTSWQ